MLKFSSIERKWIVDAFIAGVVGVLLGVVWPYLKIFLSGSKDALAGMQSLITVLGIPAALFWWWKQRKRYPRLDMKVSAVHRWVSTDVVWLHVCATLENKGNILAELKSGYVWVQQIIPVPENIQAELASGRNPVPDSETQAPWAYLSKSTTIPHCEIEPGESGVCEWDFFISECAVDTILVNVHVANSMKARDEEMGWDASIVYDLEKNGVVSIPFTAKGVDKR